MPNSLPTIESLRLTRNELRGLIALLVVAGLLRLGLICWKPATLSEDRDLYWGLAQSLAAGQGFIHPNLGHLTAYRPPLYPIMLAIIVGCGGGVATLAAIQIACGVATVGLTGWLGQQLGLARASWLAAAFVAFNPLLIQSTGLAMTETLCTFLVVVVLCLAIGLRNRSLHEVKLASQLSPPDDRQLNIEFIKRFALGVCIGLTALCRPTMWAFVVLSVATTFAFARSRRVRWRKWLPIAVGCLLVVTPWVVRNMRVFGQPMLTTTHGGYTLLLGNNDEAYREEVSQPTETLWDSRAWQAGIRQEMQQVGLEDKDEVACDRWQSDRAKTWITQHPHEFVAACWLRIKRFWNISPAGADVQTLPQVIRWGIAVFYFLELSAAAAGVWKLRRVDWPLWELLLVLIVSFALTHVVYWSNLRMRAPLEPALALLAARGLCFAQLRMKQGGTPNTKSCRNCEVPR